MFIGSQCIPRRQDPFSFPCNNWSKSTSFIELLKSNSLNINTISCFSFSNFKFKIMSFIKGKLFNTLSLKIRKASTRFVFLTKRKENKEIIQWGEEKVKFILGSWLKLSSLMLQGYIHEKSQRKSDGNAKLGIQGGNFLPRSILNYSRNNPFKCFLHSMKFI